MSRNVRDGPTRQITAIGSCAALGDAWRQMSRRVAHALSLGAARATLAEVTSLVTVAVGFPIALNAAADKRAGFDKEAQK